MRFAPEARANTQATCSRLRRWNKPYAASQQFAATFRKVSHTDNSRKHTSANVKSPPITAHLLGPFYSFLLKRRTHTLPTRAQNTQQTQQGNVCVSRFASLWVDERLSLTLRWMYFSCMWALFWGLGLPPANSITPISSCLGSPRLVSVKSPPTISVPGIRPPTPI